ncbi:MAG: hypothetical protein MJ246_05280 [Clostridia bacterium]|nr:hypothetical protein [Clostridia bacterium]
MEHKQRELIGYSVELVFGIAPEDGRLRFTFNGLKTLPDKNEKPNYLFNQIREYADEIKLRPGKANIEYQKKEVFNLETCITVYLIDWIKSGNNIEDIDELFLEAIYKSEEVQKEFEKIDDEVLFAHSKDEFFEKENSAISIIHSAFQVYRELQEEEANKDKVVITDEVVDAVKQKLNAMKGTDKEEERKKNNIILD